MRYAIGLSLALAGGSGLAIAAHASGGVPIAPTSKTCAVMAVQQFGDGVRITSAKRVEAVAASTHSSIVGQMVSPALPAHCRIEGVVGERDGAGGKRYGIGFALSLPERWSGRFLLQGGGGLNGHVPPPTGPVATADVPALARGFAVLSHDSGHQGAVFDSSFMVDQRAALDFAESSVRVMAELGKRITGAYYEKAPSHSYMSGCSTGGREGMLALQRYPESFDGIIVGAPAMRTGYSNFAIQHSNVMFNRAAPRGADGQPQLDKLFPAGDRKLILDGMLQQCDGLDGLKDGMIMNVAQCNFKPARLQCSGDKRDDCLSKAQVDAMDAAFAGPKDRAGYPYYVPMPYDTGIVDAGGPIPGYLPTGAPGPFGPVTRAVELDLDAEAQKHRMDASQRLTDTHVWTNLSTFLDRGGKVLFYHGVSDPWFSALDTWDYWQRTAAANGARWDNASRFYMMPGLGHCGGGNAFDQFDLLDPLTQWVEQGKAPEGLVVKRSKGTDARPLCAHPAYPHYVRGDPKRAESFECRTPAL